MAEPPDVEPSPGLQLGEISPSVLSHACAENSTIVPELLVVETKMAPEGSVLGLELITAEPLAIMPALLLSQMTLETAGQTTQAQ